MQTLLLPGEGRSSLESEGRAAPAPVPQSEPQQAKDSPWLVVPLHRADFSCTELPGCDIPFPQGARQDYCIWASIPLRRASPSEENRRSPAAQPGESGAASQGHGDSHCRKPRGMLLPQDNLAEGQSQAGEAEAGEGL